MIGESCIMLNSGADDGKSSTQKKTWKQNQRMEDETGSSGTSSPEVCCASCSFFILNPAVPFLFFWTCMMFPRLGKPGEDACILFRMSIPLSWGRERAFISRQTSRLLREQASDSSSEEDDYSDPAENAENTPNLRANCVQHNRGVIGLGFR
jgi:hypothetical protein